MGTLTLAAIAVSDHFIIKRSVRRYCSKDRDVKLARWFFPHAFANALIVLTGLKAVWTTFTDPMNAFDSLVYSFTSLFGAASSWPLTIVNAVHVYHMVGGFSLTGADYFHHLLFIPPRLPRPALAMGLGRAVGRDLHLGLARRHQLLYARSPQDGPSRGDGREAHHRQPQLLDPRPRHPDPLVHRLPGRPLQQAHAALLVPPPSGDAALLQRALLLQAGEGDAPADGGVQHEGGREPPPADDRRRCAHVVEGGPVGAAARLLIKRKICVCCLCVCGE